MRSNLSPTVRRAPRFAMGLVAALALAACGGSSGGGQPQPQPQPGSGYQTFQAAALVLGQSSFTANTANQGGAASAATMSAPHQVCISKRGLLAVDAANNRVLGWTNVPATNGDDADWVIGHMQFDQTGGVTGIGELNGPSGVGFDGTSIWVADSSSNRLVAYTPEPTQNGAGAALVLGQADFFSNGQSVPPAANTFAAPNGVSATATTLAVADTLNNRVLLFTPLPAANNAPATWVLGQATMAGNAINQGGTPTAATMSQPYGVWTDGTKVVVADLANNRVLIWNSFPTADGQAADLVLGQASMTTSSIGSGATGMRGPSDVTSDGTRLFVADCENNRVLVWNTWPTTNGQAADAVLGQSDFNHTAANDDDQDGTPDASCTARTFFSSNGYLWVHAEGGSLWVGDRRNNRVLRFDPS